MLIRKGEGSLTGQVRNPAGEDLINLITPALFVHTVTGLHVRPVAWVGQTFLFACDNKTHPHCLSPACRHKLLITFHNSSEEQGSTKLLASSKTGSTQTEFLLKHTPSPIWTKSVCLLMDANNNVFEQFNTIAFLLFVWFPSINTKLPLSLERNIFSEICY